MEDEKEEKTELELDVLDIANALKQSAEAPRFRKRERQPVVSGRKGSTFRKIAILVSNNKTLFFAFLACLLVASCVFLCYLLLPKISMPEMGSRPERVGAIVYQFSCPIGDRHYVRFKLSVPFKDNKEKADLMRKLPKIKHQLLISGNRPDVAESIERKDIDTLKQHILKGVHDITGVPIGQLDLQGLSLD